MSLVGVGSTIIPQGGSPQILQTMNKCHTDKKIQCLVFGLGVLSLIVSLVMQNLIPMGLFLVGACSSYVATKTFSPNISTVLPIQQVAQRIISPDVSFGTSTPSSQKNSTPSLISTQTPKGINQKSLVLSTVVSKEENGSQTSILDASSSTPALASESKLNKTPALAFQPSPSLEIITPSSNKKGVTSNIHSQTLMGVNHKPLVLQTAVSEGKKRRTEGKDSSKTSTLVTLSSTSATASENGLNKQVVAPRSSASTVRKKKNTITIKPGETALSAAGAGRWKVVNKLLKSGANPNQVDSDNGQTLLMKATLADNHQTVKLLIKMNADVMKVDSLEETALMKAVKYGFVKIAEEILKVDSSSLSIKNKAGETLMDLAGKSGKLGLVISLFSQKTSAS